MEKILLAVDAMRPNKNALEFACYLGRLMQSTVTGIFLENQVGEAKLSTKQMHGMAFENWGFDDHVVEYQGNMEQVNRNMEQFKEGCIKREVSHRLHLGHGIPANELLEESRFADLLVLDAEMSFKKTYEGTPTGFVKDILKNAACPVIIAPEHFEEIDQVVLTYNGSNASLFAIRQFTYLFPQLRKKKTIVLQMNEEGQWHAPEKYRLKEWLGGHYTDLHFEVIRGNADTDLFDHLFKRKNMFLVMGAYSRTALSQTFKRSHADILIRTIIQPIFIAHP